MSVNNWNISKEDNFKLFAGKYLDISLVYSDI